MHEQTIEQASITTRRRKKPEGIEVRHSRECRTNGGGNCNCRPTYRAEVWSNRDKKKIRKSFPTLAAAKGWRIDMLKAVQDRRVRATTPKTLAQEATDWLAGAREGRILTRRKKPYRRNAIANYERSLRLYVLPELGSRRLSDIEHGDLLRLQEDLQARCGPSTVRNAFTPLQAIYRRAKKMSDSGVVIDPTNDLELPQPGRRDRAASVPEARELLDILPELERCIYAMAFYAGLRRGEMRGLRVGDVDLASKTMRVERGWDEVDGPIDPKSASSARTVFVLDALAPFVEPLVEDRAPDALVFGYDDATPFDPRAVARKAERALKAENTRRTKNEEPLIARYTLHEGRHSFISWAIDAGIAEASVARYAGHSTGGIAITRRYTHAVSGQLGEDMKRLDAYIAGRIGGKVVALAAAS